MGYPVKKERIKTETGKRIIDRGEAFNIDRSAQI